MLVLILHLPCSHAAMALSGDGASMRRRDVLKGATAAAALAQPAAALARVPASAGPTNEVVGIVDGIRQKRLGGSGIVVSEVGLGTQRWGSTDFNGPDVGPAGSEASRAASPPPLEPTRFLGAAPSGRSAFRRFGSPGERLRPARLAPQSRRFRRLLTLQEAACHALMDRAILGSGVNLIDTAEQYPIPSDDLTGRFEGYTEQIIGKWLAKDKVQRRSP